MPIIPPILDDRSFDDLVDEALRRIPAHTPEWTNPRVGDPGRAIIDLFAWLTDTLLYRANLVPERQRLAFLRLLGASMRPATAARGVVSVLVDDADATAATTIAALATVKGPVPFETTHELTVFPVTMEAYYKQPVEAAYKRTLTASEQRDLQALLTGLKSVYGLKDDAVGYVTTAAFTKGAAEPTGFDVVGRTLDHTLWLALLAPKPEHVEAVRAALGSRPEGSPRLLNIGVVPALEQAPDASLAAQAALVAAIGPRPPVPHAWEISAVDAAGEVEYHALDVVADTTKGLTERGVVRLALPSAEFIGAPPEGDDVVLTAGVGDRPPRLDVPETAARLVAWLRLRPADAVGSLPLSWIGVNGAEIDQRTTMTARVVGQSNGAPDQVFALNAPSVEPATLVVQVDETGRGYVPWTRVDDLAVAGRDDGVFALDPEAGTITFGDGVRGRIPEAGRRVRVALMRAGGGEAGNLAPGVLKEISATGLDGAPVAARLKVQQSVATVGGDRAETLDEAERRIPAIFHHHDRAVTEADFRELAATTPGARLGRVEVLPRFKPQQRRDDVPGVTTVMVLPRKDGTSAPDPRPDRPLLETVYAYLDQRRTLGTELYVIGCEYVPLALAVGVSLRTPLDQDTVLRAVREALRGYLWPLAPGGIDGTGWPLERPVTDRELEVVVARVPGVSMVHGVRLFTRAAAGAPWRLLPAESGASVVQLPLARWQLPELLAVAVATDGSVPADLRGVLGAGGTSTGGSGTGAGTGDGRPIEIGVPVVPEVC